MRFTINLNAFTIDVNNLNIRNKVYGMDREEWKLKFDKEISKGEAAQKSGNVGMARVCARRAAGIVIREYLKRNSVDLPRLNNVLMPGASALNHLKYFCDDPNVPQFARVRAQHFLLQLTPDHIIPGNPDLIEDAKWLAKELLID